MPTGDSKQAKDAIFQPENANFKQSLSTVLLTLELSSSYITIEELTKMDHPGMLAAQIFSYVATNLKYTALNSVFQAK